MIEWISKWIGSDVPDNSQKGLPIYIERRNMKRALVCAVMDQLVQSHCNGKECDCAPPFRPDCSCFTEVNNSVPTRIRRVSIRWLKIKGIYATFPILIALFFNHLK